MFTFKGQSNSGQHSLQQLNGILLRNSWGVSAAAAGCAGHELPAIAPLSGNLPIFECLE